MKNVLIVLLMAVGLYACKSQSGAVKRFKVSGTITNNPAKVIYLEEIPMTTMQRMIVDSSVLDKNGKYSLKAAASDARVYNLRLDNNQYPMAAIINDASSIKVNATFSKENNQFANSYEVEGSKASNEMKDFMVSFNNSLQTVFMTARQGDSLSKLKVPDSVLLPLQNKMAAAATDARNLATTAIKNSSNPALTMFLLGYYQSTANNPGLGLQPIDNEEVKKIVVAEAAKYPKHEGLAYIKTSLEKQETPTAQAGVSIGTPAPEFILPDPTGKQIALSSFRGKYVLVDFWASWCRPCREENPNVVKAFQKFKNKNFTILGVSLDRPGGKDAWMNAVMKDNLTWTQVSDLKFWESEVVPLYRIEGIPYNVLIDPQGKIVAENLRGPDLEKTLAGVLN